MRLLAAAVLAIAPAWAAAADEAACARFAWPVAAERGWFAAPGLPGLASNATPGAVPAAGFAAALTPMADVRFERPPQRAPRKPDTYGGAFAFTNVPAGLYQVTLSGEAWIDLVQRGGLLAEQGHTGVHDCPGLRKSVRFKVSDGPLVLQLSGAVTARLNVALTRVE